MTSGTMSNFFRYDDELMAVYRDISDVVSRKVMSHLSNRGFLVIHKNARTPPKVREKIHYYRLHSDVVDRCQMGA